MDSGPPLTSWANVTENGDGNVTSEMGDDDSCLERTWFNSDQLAGELNLCPSPSNSTEDDFNTFYFYQVRTRQMQYHATTFHSHQYIAQQLIISTLVDWHRRLIEAYVIITSLTQENLSEGKEHLKRQHNPGRKTAERLLLLLVVVCMGGVELHSYP